MVWAKQPVKKTKRKRHVDRFRNLKIVLRTAEHYRTIMPDKKGHRIAIWVAFFVVSGIIAVQLLYPLDRALPFARIDAMNVGFGMHDEMAKLLTEQFDKTKVKLTVEGKSVEYPLKSAGAEPNTERMIERLSDYPFWQRFIPLSLLWQLPQVKEVDVYYTDIVLQRFSEERRTELSFGPANARLALHGDKIVATPEKSGSETTAKQIHAAIAAAHLQLGKTTIVTVQTKKLTAAHSMAELKVVKAQAESALTRQVVIKVNDKTFAPDKAETTAWLVIDTAADGGVTLRTDSERIKAYLASIDKQVGTPAGQTNITIVDGRETGRTTGALGKTLNSDALVAQLATFVLKGEGPSTIVAQLVDVQPSVIFNSKYTATQEGLQAYVNDVSRSRNALIMIRQLDGAGWAASARANESIPSGSTYKLFVALMLFDKMQKGEISWNDPILDTNVDTCFNRMTIASTNPCAEQWLAEWGRSTVNDFVYAHGFSSGTTFTHPEATHTTAADLTKYMAGLNDGSLVAEPYRSRLLHSLSVHPYRYGIPTGSGGQVWDKVGFLWDYVHDTAIVHHPRGTYLMTIMTKGQSYATIASITREVERIMYP